MINTVLFFRYVWGTLHLCHLTLPCLLARSSFPVRLLPLSHSCRSPNGAVFSLSPFASPCIPYCKDKGGTPPFTRHAIPFRDSLAPPPFRRTLFPLCARPPSATVRYTLSDFPFSVFSPPFPGRATLYFRFQEEPCRTGWMSFRTFAPN